MAETRSDFIYICYSRQDRNRIRPVLNRLEEYGLNYRASKFGVSHYAEDANNAKQAGLYIVCLTDKAREDDLFHAATVNDERDGLKRIVLVLDEHAFDGGGTKLSWKYPYTVIDAAGCQKNSHEPADLLIHSGEITQDFIHSTSPIRKYRRLIILFGSLIVLTAAGVFLWKNRISSKWEEYSMMMTEYTGQTLTAAPARQRKLP